ncbi:hypothetical protein ACJBU6_00803 [Exserohilum turcicum]
MVEAIRDLRKIGRQWKYLVKWQGWPDSQNTWEPEENLTNCKSLIREYHRAHPEKRGQGPQGKGSNQGIKDRRSQPVTSPDQPTVQIAVVRQQEGPYQGQSSPRPPLSHDLGQRLSQGHGAQKPVFCSSPPGAHDANETSQRQPELGALQPELPPTLCAPVQPEFLPTLSQKRTSYTQHQPKCTQHNDQKMSPQSNGDSSLHSAYSENPFLHPLALRARRERASDQLMCKDGEREISVPWAWLGRLEIGRNGYRGPGPTDLICSRRFNTRHGKTIFQGIGTIRLRGGIMLQVTRRIP